MTEPTLEHQMGSENVFGDLGLPDADALLAKARLAQQISVVAGARGLTQTQTARILETTQPKVSALMAGKLAGFSIERLIRFLNALGQDVDIHIAPKPSRSERATVRVTARSGVRGPHHSTRR